MTLEILTLLLTGAIAGILAGLLGVGGGIIIVPALVWVFQQHPAIPTDSVMQLAVGTSLATIVITSLSSIYAHHRRGAVQWTIVKHLTPGIMIGASLGAVVADLLSSDVLQTVFALFLLTVSLQLAFGAQPAPHRQLPQWWGMTGIAIIIGKISALVGVGGGSLTVPFLTWCRIPIRYAVATSAACGLPIALTGAIGFMLMGQTVTNLPPWTTGYIYWPAFIIIISMTLLFAPVGAKIAHTVPVTALKKIFAIFLAIVGLNMLLN